MPFPYDLNPDEPGRWDREKLAFAHWVAQLIAEANGAVDLSELALMARLFPDSVLEGYGLVGPAGELTPEWDQARMGAIKHLHQALTLDEKLELVTVFHEVCMADQELVQSELLVLREAAEALGVGVRDLSDHLKTLR